MKISVIVKLLVFCSFLVYVGTSHINYEAISLDSHKPAEVSQYDPVHFFIPFVRWIDVAPCSEFFNEDEEFKKALECGVPLYGEALDSIKPPSCFIVKENSLGVIKGDGFNYLTLFLSEGKILGFYEPQSATTFIAENIDMAKVYRHEVQHHVLHLLEGDGDASHSHIFWVLCEPPYYEPSEESLERNKGRKTSFQNSIIDLFK